MEMRHLRYFVAVAEELNFTRAALRLHIAQPPLSTQIRALEEEIGAELFVRDTRRVFLTQAGKEFLVRARAILAAAQQATEAARSASAGIFGRIALGVTASAMFTERLPRALRGFGRDHAHVEIDLQEMASVAQLGALYERALDVGILRKPDMRPPEGVHLEQWYRAPLVAAVPEGHALARQDAVAMADLADEALITYPRDAGIGLYWPVMQLCAQAGFRPRVVREAREPAFMVGLVAAGLGIAIVPQDTRCMALEGVAYKPITEQDAASTLYLAYRAADTDPHTAAMLATLRAVASTP